MNFKLEMEKAAEDVILQMTNFQFLVEGQNILGPKGEISFPPENVHFPSINPYGVVRDTPASQPSTQDKSLQFTARTTINPYNPVYGNKTPPDYLTHHPTFASEADKEELRRKSSVT